MEISDFAQREAGYIRASLTDEKWDALLTKRPELADALAARQATLRAWDAQQTEGQDGA
ncbi:hypothetical protein [Streptomyces cyaneofuscatus]|uniref:hypothetical protein n=1 Tax=Streptomyces cyaneofuscatus TaxID=66883 RepID=UPI0037A7134C